MRSSIRYLAEVKKEILSPHTILHLIITLWPFEAKITCCRLRGFTQTRKDSLASWCEEKLDFVSQTSLCLVTTNVNCHLGEEKTDLDSRSISVKNDMCYSGAKAKCYFPTRQTSLKDQDCDQLTRRSKVRFPQANRRLITPIYNTWAWDIAWLR